MAAWVFALAPTASAQNPPELPRYRVIDLGVVGMIDDVPFIISVPHGINDRGEIAGALYAGEVFMHGAFLWLPGPRHGLPQGLTSLNAVQWLDLLRVSEGLAINESTQIAGWETMHQGTPTEAIVIDIPEQTVVRLGTLPEMQSSRATGINNLSPPTVVGWAAPQGGLTEQLDPRAWRLVLDSQAIMEKLLLTGYTNPEKFGRAYDVSDQDEIVGEFFIGTPGAPQNSLCDELWRGVRWPAWSTLGLSLSPYVPLGSPPLDDQPRAQSRAVNNAGNIVGWGRNPAQEGQGDFGFEICLRRGLFWENWQAEPIALPHLSGYADNAMRANAIAEPDGNSRVCVVGQDIHLEEAVLWVREGSTWWSYNLNDIACNSPFGTLHEATAINNHGWIAGWGTVPGGGLNIRAFLMVPSTYCTADINGDFVVDVLDLLDLLSSWGPCPQQGCCAADLNGSGAVDVQDLLILLGSWGPCPDIDINVPSLAQTLDDAGLTQQQWNDYQAVMTGDEHPRVKENWTCWMKNYLMQCVNCPKCPGSDPFAD